MQLLFLFLMELVVKFSGVNAGTATCIAVSQHPCVLSLCTKLAEVVTWLCWITPCTDKLSIFWEPRSGKSLSGDEFRMLIFSQNEKFAQVCDVSVNKIVRIKQSVDVSQLSKLFSVYQVENSTISAFQSRSFERPFWHSSTLVEGEKISYHIHQGISQKHIFLEWFSRKKKLPYT